MARIWSLISLAIAAGGIVLMAVAHRDARESFGTDNKRYVLFVADKPEAKAEQGTSVAVYFLPPEKDVEMLADGIGGMGSAQGRVFLRNHQSAVILLPDFQERFTADMPASGALPRPGTKEVLADPCTTYRDRITVGDQELRVTGVLKKTESLQLDAYYAADNPALRNLLAQNGKSLLEAFLVPLEDTKKILELKKLFPSGQFTLVIGSRHLNRTLFYSYVAGMLLFLFGGSGLLIRCYLFAARRITNAWIGPPLAEISRHWKLFSLMHLAYFGIVIAGMAAIYELPLLQDFLLTVIRGQIESKRGVLGVAGEAYGSGNIALAAVTTLVINFFGGSLLVITLPSVIVPGIGVLMALFRATVWGILLAPAYLSLARGMILHSGTLLLEGEGYILATFFALLVPIYLFSPREGQSLGSRYLRSLLINLKGNLLVLIVLAAAATYEAIEVILQMGG
jgi:hypothetical protein